MENQQSFTQRLLIFFANICPANHFSRHAKAQTSLALVIWLNENVHIHALFLAKAMIKQAYHCSFGLTKTFV